MKVKDLIKELEKLDKELNVYLSDNELDEDTYFYKCLEVKKLNIEGEDIVSLLYRL
jgi:hypothetical protein